MQKNGKGFTVGQLVVVVLCLTILVSVLAPFIIRSTSRIMIKSHAAADAATLRSTVTNISMELLEDKGMREISEHLQPISCQTDPNARLWINYTKPVSLDAYFVNGDDFYSIDYLTEVAAHGASELDLKKPFSLGFWYEAGETE